MHHYIYIYLDPRKPGKYQYPDLNISLLFEPFYVGLGQNNRKFSHLENKKLQISSPKNAKLNKIINYTSFDIKDYILEIKSNLSYEEAIFQEKCFIKNIGRKDILTGPLTNLTDGGEGVCNMSKETKLKMSNSKLGKKQTKEQIDNRKFKNTGQLRTEKTKLKMRNSQLGKTYSKETLKKMSLARKGIIPTHLYPKYTIIDPFNNSYVINGNIETFCKEHNISYYTIHANRDKGKIQYSKRFNTELSFNTIGWEIFKN